MARDPFVTGALVILAKSESKGKSNNIQNAAIRAIFHGIVALWRLDQLQVKVENIELYPSDYLTDVPHLSDWPVGELASLDRKWCIM